MNKDRLTLRGAIAGALAAGLMLTAAPALAQVAAQPSSPVQLTGCTFDLDAGFGVYNQEAHVDLEASFVDRSQRTAKLVGVTTEFFDEQGAVVRRLDAAYSGRFEYGRPIDHLRFGLGAVRQPTVQQRCFISRIEFTDGSGPSPTIMPKSSARR